jgi:hypothetical protein
MDLFKNIDLVGIAALLSSLYVVYRFITTRKIDEISTDASTSKNYAESARIANERSKESDLRSDVMGDRVVELEETIDQLRKLIRDEANEKLQLVQLLSIWAKGITLLLYQVQGASMTAVWTPKKEDIQRFVEGV